MEYLMTYGWAILIIAVVLGALFQLGVFNSSSFSPRAPPGACQVFRPSGQGTTTNINLMGVCTGQLPQYVAQFNFPVNSYVNVPDAPSQRGMSALTVATWWYAYSWTPTYYGIISKYTSGTGRAYNLGYPWSGTISLTIADGGAGYGGTVATAPLPTIGAWHFIVGTFIGGNSVNIYVDGVLAGSTPTALTAVPNTAITPLLIGKYTTYYSNGLISNAQIYNVSLTANEIQYLYNEGIGGAPLLLQNLVGWWPLNGNSNDYSGNNNNGVPTNVVFTSQYGK